MTKKNKMSQQQRQAENYFDGVAESWKKKIHIPERQPSVPTERRAYVHHIVQRIPMLQRFLDIGCGSGELVFELAGKGVESWGTDIAAGMIELCEAQKEISGCENCHFFHGSIFDFPERDIRFQLVSALGLIEYLSSNELERLFDLLSQVLEPRGSFVVSSRNRLFNIFSVNDFTKEELKIGGVEALVGEAVAIGTAASMAECIGRLREIEVVKEQIRYFPKTSGIDVEVRPQYTPAQLIRLIEGHGFCVVALSPINYHGLPPSLKDAWPDEHVAIKRRLVPMLTDCYRALSHASTFMLHAIRAEEA